MVLDNDKQRSQIVPVGKSQALFGGVRLLKTDAGEM